MYVCILYTFTVCCTSGQNACKLWFKSLPTWFFSKTIIEIVLGFIPTCTLDKEFSPRKYSVELLFQVLYFKIIKNYSSKKDNKELLNPYLYGMMITHKYLKCGS